MPTVPHSAAAATTVAPARACAYAVLRRVFERGAYADRALQAEASALDQRDRALAMRLSYGSVQRSGTLDFLIEQLADRPAARLDPPLLAAVRLGLYELLYLRGSPDYAIVADAVELAKAHGRAGHGLVNAVLRRATREGPASLLEGLSEQTPAQAAVMHSHPEWIARLWWEQLGVERARAMLAADNEPGELALRANTLVTDAVSLAQELAVATHPDPRLPEALVTDEPFDVHASQLWGEGAFLAQSRAAMLVARALEPAPDERILDLCAAPGGKSTHIAALMGDRGEIVAIERDRRRAGGLVRTARRLRTTASRSPTRRRRSWAGRSSTACSSIRPAPGWGRCRHAPICAGGSRPPRSPRWRVCRRRSCPPARRPSVRGACLSTLRARSHLLRMSN
jgi:16S rRNA (cytosine967-C5)-methyltransferase